MREREREREREKAEIENRKFRKYFAPKLKSPHEKKILGGF